MRSVPLWGITPKSAAIDDSELRRLAVDLAAAPLRVQFGASRVLRTEVGPLLETEMKRDASGHRRLRHLPRAVSHEMRGPFEVEAGLKPGRTFGEGGQGSLAHIIAYGSVNNAPVYDHTAALRRAAPVAERWLAGMAEDAVLGTERG